MLASVRKGSAKWCPVHVPACYWRQNFRKTLGKFSIFSYLSFICFKSCFQRLYCSTLPPWRQCTPEASLNVTDAPPSHDSELYRMDHLFRGKAVIFNQENFKARFGIFTRDGTAKDRDDLAAVLRQLKWNVMMIWLKVRLETKLQNVSTVI